MQSVYNGFMLKKPHVILIVTLAILLYWHWRMGLSRFLDYDEFSYLHWASQMAKGEIPYRDFFLFIPPGFSVIFAPLFWIVRSPDVFLAARVIHFFIFAAMTGLLSVLFGITRSWKWALLPAVFFAFLPMPYDKFFEVRPDNLSTLFALAGLVSQVKRRWFVSGVFYAISLLVLPKTLPFVVAGIIVWFFARRTRWFMVGMAIPFILFFLWSISIGFSTVWYSLTRMAIEANNAGGRFVMEPHLFFFPNASFYGGVGITGGLLVNHAIWFVGIIMGVIRLFTPFVTAGGDRKRVLTELLISGTFILSVAGFVGFFPLKHSQYLIPIALFICYYAADAVALVLDKIPLLLLILAAVLVVTIGQINTKKLTFPHISIQIDQLSELQKMIPASASVFDLEGRMIYWKNPYYICCVPMGEFLPYISRPLPSIASVLESDKTEYIYQAISGRMERLPTDTVSYIHDHYAPVEGWRGELWKRKE